MIEYKYMKLNEISKYEPKMRELGVSEIARSPAGFLTAYKRAGGKPNKLSKKWVEKRWAFIRRHLVAYRSHPTYRRKLALIAWAYMP